MVTTRQHRVPSSKAKFIEVESSDSDFIPTSPRTRMAPRSTAYGASAPAPFISKTYEMVNDPSTDNIISWSNDGTSFTVLSTETFSKELLPLHFKHNNFSSFVRQLNTYRFRKIDPDSWTFKNDNFIRGRPDQLGLIVRKTSDGPKVAKGGGKTAASNVQPALEVGAYGGYGNSSLDAVRRDNALLRQEVIRLRHEMEISQAQSESKINAMEKKMDRFDRERRNLIAGIAQALQHPGLMQHLVASSPNVMRIEDGRRRRKVAKKRTGGVATSDDHSSEEDGDTEYDGNNQQLVVHQGQQSPFADLANQFMQMLTTSTSAGRDEMEAAERYGMNDTNNINPHRIGPLVEEAENSQASPRPNMGVYNDTALVHPMVDEPVDDSFEVGDGVNDLNDLTLSPNLDNINLDDFDLGSIGEFDGNMSLTESDIERIANRK